MKSNYPAILLALLFLLPSIHGKSQLMQFTIGGSGNELATKVKYLPSDQSTIIAGYSYDYIGGVVSNCQAIVMKVYHGGTIAWQKTFGVLTKNNIIKDMIITHDNNIILVGTVGGNGSLYSDNTAAMLKYNSIDGSLMWQTCFRNSATTTGGELLCGVTELTDGTNRLVAVGNHNLTPSGAGGMICVFQEDGTLTYNQVLDIANGDDLYSVATSPDGNSVFISGVYVGTNYKDGRIFKYTPGTTSGTVNWTKYFDFALPGSLTNNFFNKVYVSGSKLIVSSGSLYGYTTTGGEGHCVITMNASDGSGAQIRTIKNSGMAYANMSAIAVVDSDHVFTIQSPGIAHYDAVVWLTGTSSNTVVNDITSLSGSTSNPPVKFKSSSMGLHSFSDMNYYGGLLHLAGATTVPTGFGNNDIYYVASATGLASVNHDCDTGHESITMTSPSFTNPSTTYTTFSFTPAYFTVDTGTTHYSIHQLCGDLDIVVPTAVNTVKSTSPCIYPNPAGNLLTVKATYTINTLSLSNMLGQLVYKGSFSSNEVTINIKDLPKGMYFVNVNNTSVQKIIKE